MDIKIPVDVPKGMGRGKCGGGFEDLLFKIG
jgi:hypothetical protein